MEARTTAVHVSTVPRHLITGHLGATDGATRHERHLQRRRTVAAAL